MKTKSPKINNSQSVLSWNPYREMLELQRQFDENLMQFEELMTPLSINVWEEDKDFVVEASVPGINPKNLDISLEGRRLIISGETKEEQDSQDKKKKYHIHEKSYNSLYRTITLPQDIDENNITATCKDGLLKIEIPKTKPTEIKKITVKQ